MLNQPLYDALVKIFHKVDVVNEGVHADITVHPGGTGEWSVARENESGEEYRVNCPFCKDTKGHLYISHLSYAAPIVGGMQLRTCHLLAHCFRRECLKEAANRDVLAGWIGLAMVGSESTPLIIEDKQDDLPAYNVSNDLTMEGLRTWIPDWRVIDEDTDPNVLAYLEERRISEDDIKWLNIGWGPIRSPRTGEYINRGLPWVLFPITRNGRLAGVQARAPECYLSETGIKYYFHPACRKKTVVFNLDVARQLGIGVLCEGVFDVASVGKPGICIFGHTPSIAQKRLIAANLQGLIWIPDTDVSPVLDAIAIARKQIEDWNSAGVFIKGAHLVRLPEKDAGSMTRQAVWESIVQQVPSEMQDYLLEKIIPKI